MISGHACALVLAASLLLPSGARADRHEPAREWAGQLGGLDGVTVICANSNREKYAAGICDQMTGKAMEIFGKAGIPAVFLGSYYTHEENPPQKPEEFASPLVVTIFVRGSDSGNIHAINLRSRISVDYDAAVERGTDGPARKGELVMWEGSTTGAGPLKGLSAAIAGAAWEKLERELQPLIAAWPNR